MRAEITNLDETTESKRTPGIGRFVDLRYHPAAVSASY